MTSNIQNKYNIPIKPEEKERDTNSRKKERKRNY